MIWLKENQSIVGCVPSLKRTYSEKEIRQMSKYNCYPGWSELSKFVMKIQGIGFLYDGGFSDKYKVGAQRLVDICFDFDFECFLFPSDLYLIQIFDVFENLTLYKLEELSEKEIKKELSQAKKKLERLVSVKTLFNIDKDFSNTLRVAERSFTNLSNLQKLLIKKGYILEKSQLFANIDESTMKKIYDERETNTILEMRED